MKSAYIIQMGCIAEDRWPGWELLWKLWVQQWVKDCVWLMAHGRVLTSEARWHRGMASSAGCVRCDGLMEDVMHVLRHCPRAREIRSVFRPEEKIRDFTSIPLKEWFFEYLKSHGEAWCGSRGA